MKNVLPAVLAGLMTLMLIGMGTTAFAEEVSDDTAVDNEMIVTYSEATDEEYMTDTAAATETVSELAAVTEQTAEVNDQASANGSAAADGIVAANGADACASPENAIIPETDENPENAIIPENDENPENAIIPETDANPENVMISETDADPEITDGSENDAETDVTDAEGTAANAGGADGAGENAKLHEEETPENGGKDMENPEDADNEDAETPEENSVPATSGICGENLTWEIGEDGILTIKGTGAMTDYEPEGSPWFLSAGSIRTVQLPEGLTGIGQNAFEGCISLKDVYYEGTETEKENTNIARGNELLVNAVWHYAKNTITDGFNKIKGIWGWYEKGALRSTLTGLIKGTISGQTDWYYIKNGVYSENTGLTRAAKGSNTNWYYVRNGKFTPASGLAQKADGSGSAWYYVKDGVYTKATGLAQRADGTNSNWYFVKNGKYTISTGIAQRLDGSDSNWYYVLDGIYTPATGASPVADGSTSRWFYVEDGVFTKATGLAFVADGSDTYNRYYFKNGVFNRATGLVQYADGSSDLWYYVKNGVFEDTAGLTRKADGSDPTWYYVRGGVTVKDTCVAGIIGGSSSRFYYVTDGVFDNSFSGTYYAFTVSDGIVTKVKTSGKGWQYVKGDLYYYWNNKGYLTDTVVTVKGVQYIFDYNGKYIKDGVFSPLATSVHAIDKYYERQGNDITRITLHHMAGVSTGSDCSYYFCTNGLENSSNYCIGVDGDISCNVVENYGSWTSSSNYNDRRAICIELSDSNESYTKMSGATIEALINLCVDLIQRYPSLGGKFDYKEDGTGNITLHSMFADKDCPGQWLVSRLPKIQAEVNRRLAAGESDPGPDNGTEEDTEPGSDPADGSEDDTEPGSDPADGAEDEKAAGEDEDSSDKSETDTN